MANMFYQDGIYVVTTNCVGVMGAGLAKEAKHRFPGLEAVYRQALMDAHHGLGHPYLARSFGPHGILLFATKDHWRDPSRIEWIEQGLDALRRGIDAMPELRMETWLFPPLGCGLGGLPREEVIPLMKEKLDGLNYHIF